MGALREHDTYQATVESLALPPIRQLLTNHRPETISTVTVLRETLACRLGSALTDVGVGTHYGDAFIGASHIKGNGTIKTAYLYENTEGLHPTGLWVIADSICLGRNLLATLTSLLKKYHPAHLLFLAPIASRVGINAIGVLTASHHIPTTFLAWGALFGVDKKTRYDMPWGHPDTEPLDQRDQRLFVSIYGPKLCMGGDFGNNYYCPTLAMKLYENQLRQHNITVHPLSAKDVTARYQPGELVIRT